LRRRAHVGDNSFLQFVLDRLGELDVTARSMFGGNGLYSGGLMFGIVYDDALYLKVDDDNREGYLDAGSEPFSPNERQTLTSYYEVPSDIVDSVALVDWADAAISAAADVP
jgi:DNA transformation protein and related proteins